MTTRMTRKLFVMIFLLVFCLPALSSARHGDDPLPKLLVVWTSGDREVALKMVFVHSTYVNQQIWWGKVRLLVWGPSAKLLAEDKELQENIQKMVTQGIEVIADEQCANSYNVSETLRGLGIPVFNLEKLFIAMLKSDWKILTF